MTIWEALLATCGVILFMGVLLLIIIGITILTTVFSLIGYILVGVIIFGVIFSFLYILSNVL